MTAPDPGLSVPELAASRRRGLAFLLAVIDGEPDRIAEMAEQEGDHDQLVMVLSQAVHVAACALINGEIEAPGVFRRALRAETRRLLRPDQ